MGMTQEEMISKISGAKNKNVPKIGKFLIFWEMYYFYINIIIHLKILKKMSILKLKLDFCQNGMELEAYLLQELLNQQEVRKLLFPSKIQNIGFYSDGTNSSKTLKNPSSGCCEHKSQRNRSRSCQADFLGKISNILDRKEIQLQSNYELMQMLKISKLLCLSQLSSQIQRELQANFDDYDFFSLFTVSKVCSITWLENRCLSQLRKHKFEQLNFNLYDLLQCDQQIFETIISIHQQYVTKGVCKGLSQRHLRHIITQYNEANKVEMNPEEILNNHFQIIQELKQEDSTQQDQLSENSCFGDEKIFENEEFCSETESITSPTSQVSQSEMII